MTTNPNTDTNNNIQIIGASWVIPMTENGKWHENYAVVIKDNQIINLLDFEQARITYREATHQFLEGQVLMPGFVNSHCHAAMNLLRGLSDDLPLKEWLETAIWPTEAKFVNDSFIYQGTQHAVAEMIRSGTTCVQDMYFIPGKAADVIEESGLRASLGLVVIDFPTNWTKDGMDCIDQGIRTYHQYKNSERVSFNLSPHAPYTVGKETLEKIVQISNDYDLPIQMHIHETAGEVESFIEEHGVRPLTRLKELGMLTPKLSAVHMTQLNEGEIEWLAETGTHVIHCPQSNMKLASGVCPTLQLIEAGVNVAIGTDGAASNNDLDMIDEVRSASLLAKLDYLNPIALDSYTALYMATMGGAKALGLSDTIGSLEKGKIADIISIDLNRIETQPVYNPISQIVYASSRDQVTNVWVDGKQLMENRHLTTLNIDEILTNVNNWQFEIAKTQQSN